MMPSINDDAFYATSANNFLFEVNSPTFHFPKSLGRWANKCTSQFSITVNKLKL